MPFLLHQRVLPLASTTQRNLSTLDLPQWDQQRKLSTSIIPLIGSSADKVRAKSWSLSKPLKGPNIMLGSWQLRRISEEA
jgi:hypothetical protein